MKLILAVVKPFKVVVDAGNGMGGLVATRMFAKLPCQVIEMCYEPDGSFRAKDGAARFDWRGARFG